MNKDEAEKMMQPINSARGFLLENEEPKQEDDFIFVCSQQEKYKDNYQRIGQIIRFCEESNANIEGRRVQDVIDRALQTIDVSAPHSQEVLALFLKMQGDNAPSAQAISEKAKAVCELFSNLPMTSEGSIVRMSAVLSDFLQMEGKNKLNDVDRHWLLDHFRRLTLSESDTFRKSERVLQCSRDLMLKLLPPNSIDRKIIQQIRTLEKEIREIETTKESIRRLWDTLSTGSFPVQIMTLSLMIMAFPAVVSAYMITMQSVEEKKNKIGQLEAVYTETDDDKRLQIIQTFRESGSWKEWWLGSRTSKIMTQNQLEIASAAQKDTAPGNKFFQSVVEKPSAPEQTTAEKTAKSPDQGP